MVTDSELSDQFSLDTVGSHGSVKCKSHKKEYQVSETYHANSLLSANINEVRTEQHLSNNIFLLTGWCHHKQQQF